MGFLKSLFSGNTQQNTENDKQKNIQKKFDIFKYDGMRAQRAGQIDFAIKFFTEAIALQKDFEAMNYLSQAYIQKGELDDAGAAASADRAFHAPVPTPACSYDRTLLIAA